MRRALDKGLKELTVLLTDMSRLHQDLLSAANRKLEAIRSADTEVMQQASRREEELARSIKDREGLRQALMERLGGPLGLSAGRARRLTIGELAERVAEPVRSRLTVLGGEIRKLASEIARVNRINALVSHEMLKHFRTVYDSIARGSAPREFYGRTGRPRTAAPTALIDTTG
jgi:hypothetical protein